MFVHSQVKTYFEHLLWLLAGPSTLIELIIIRALVLATSTVPSWKVCSEQLSLTHPQGADEKQYTHSSHGRGLSILLYSIL